MRSFLFVPADSEGKLAKAAGSGADALILDLEDSVAGANKRVARSLAAAYLKEAGQNRRGPKLYVRINSLETAWWQDDIAGVIEYRPDGIVLPKPRSGEDVHRLSIALDQAEADAGIEAGTTAIIAIATELPGAVLQMDSFTAASPRLEALTWGAEDLSAEIGALATRLDNGRWTPPFALARNLCLFAARAADAMPIDTVFVDFRDQDGLRHEATEAARDGFTGKLAIHPDQVGAINDIFTPPPEAIARAKEIIAIFAAEDGAGGRSGVVSHAGRMLDRPHLVAAKRLLARAKAAGV